MNSFFRTVSRIAFLAFALFIMSCAPPTNDGEMKDETDYVQIESEVRSMLEAYLAAIRERGLSAEFDYLDTTSQFFWAPPGYNNHLDYDSVRTILEDIEPGLQSVNNNWISLDVNVLGQDHALYKGLIKSVVTDTVNVINIGTLIETGIVVRRADGWKILAGQSAFADN